MANQGLADDPDSLARLGRAVARQRLRQHEVVDARALGSPVLLRPGHTEPALLGQLPHEGPLGGRLDGLGQLLGVRVHDVVRAVRLEEAFDLALEATFLFGKLEVHAASVGDLRAPQKPI